MKTQFLTIDQKARLTENMTPEDRRNTLEEITRLENIINSYEDAIEMVNKKMAVDTTFKSPKFN